MAADNRQFDAFIDVAGIWHDQDRVHAGMKLAEYTSEQIMATMHVALTSAMVLVAKLLPRMQNGTVIGVSGTFESAAGWLPYYVSKRGLEDFLVGLS